MPILRDRHIAQVLKWAKSNLISVRDAANSQAAAIYAAVKLPPQLFNDESQARGSVPQDILAAWGTPGEEGAMDTETRRRLYERIAEDVMSDWPPDVERPDMIFYSNQVPQPPGTIKPPDPKDDWSGYNGVAMGGDIYINYDIMANSTSPSQAHTVVHELQHIEQGHMRRQYDDMVKADPGIVDDIRAGRKPDPFVSQGSTIDEVERFQVPYESARRPDGSSNPYYYHQSTEIDARRAGTEYLDHLTPEQIAKLLED